MPRVRTLSELETDNPRVIRALREASAHLKGAGVRHAAIGAIAVGVHGWPRTTADVDNEHAPLLTGRFERLCEQAEQELAR